MACDKLDLPDSMRTRVSAAPAIDEDTRPWRRVVSAGILGWVLDAFDFFVVIFLLGNLASSFHVGKADIVYTLTLTLATRPLGALIFGSLADRYGRRLPLIGCVLFFSITTIFCGLTRSYLVFLALRGLYGIGMGGYWGIGASYTMEAAPRRRRGIISGIMQAGYPVGYLLAAVATETVAPALGWHSLFFVGSAITVAIVLLVVLAPESDTWKLHRTASLGKIFRTLFQHGRIFGYLLLVMAAMSCLSHGTQDLYPDFLRSIPKIHMARLLGMQSLYGIPIVYNIAAIIGALVFGQVSERIGRKRSMMLAMVVCMAAIPAWAFGDTVLALALGSCFMQAGVQGAFGVIPAHLNELAPDAVRSLFPGFVYQLGVLVASPAVTVEFALRDRLGYPWALTLFEATVIVALLVIFAVGPERTGRDFRVVGNSQ